VAIAEAAGNTIGGMTAADRNVIAGNGGDGLLITGTAAAGNVVQGNFVGTNAAGTAGLGNASVSGIGGVHIEGAPGNLIGGAAAGAGHLIPGHVGEGVETADPGSTGN